jgi:hypothetical protein
MMFEFKFISLSQVDLSSYSKWVCGWNDTSSLVSMWLVHVKPIVQLSANQSTPHELNPGFEWPTHRIQGQKLDGTKTWQGRCQDGTKTGHGHRTNIECHMLAHYHKYTTFHTYQYRQIQTRCSIIWWNTFTPTKQVIRMNPQGAGDKIDTWTKLK